LTVGSTECERRPHSHRSGVKTPQNVNGLAFVRAGSVVEDEVRTEGADVSRNDVTSWGGHFDGVGSELEVVFALGVHVIDLKTSPNSDKDGRSSVVCVRVLAARALADFKRASVTWWDLCAGVIQAAVGWSSSVSSVRATTASSVALVKWDTVSRSGFNASRCGSVGLAIVTNFALFS